MGVDNFTVLFLAQVLGVNTIGSQELLVGYTECLANGLSDELGLKTESIAGIIFLKCVWNLVGLLCFDHKG